MAINTARLVLKPRSFVGCYTHQDDDVETLLSKHSLVELGCDHVLRLYYSTDGEYEDKEIQVIE